MKKLLILVLFFSIFAASIFSIGVVSATNVTIRGKVVDYYTGEPITDMNASMTGRGSYGGGGYYGPMYVNNLYYSQYGVVTDEKGDFEISFDAGPFTNGYTTRFEFRRLVHMKNAYLDFYLSYSNYSSPTEVNGTTAQGPKIHSTYYPAYMNPFPNASVVTTVDGENVTSNMFNINGNVFDLGVIKILPLVNIKLITDYCPNPYDAGYVITGVGNSGIYRDMTCGDGYVNLPFVKAAGDGEDYYVMINCRGGGDLSGCGDIMEGLRPDYSPHKRVSPRFQIPSSIDGGIENATFEIYYNETEGVWIFGGGLTNVTSEAPLLVTSSTSSASVSSSSSSGSSGGSSGGGSGSSSGGGSGASSGGGSSGGTVSSTSVGSSGGSGGGSGISYSSASRMIVSSSSGGSSLSASVSDDVEVEQEMDGKVYASASSGGSSSDNGEGNVIRKEIRVEPEVATETVRTQARLRNVTQIRVVSSEDNVVYEVVGEKRVRVFALFGANMEVIGFVDVETGDVIDVRAPWWSFLAAEVEEEADNA